jgi:hypothetical protein
LVPTWQKPSHSVSYSQPGSLVILLAISGYPEFVTSQRQRSLLGCHTTVQHLCSPRDGSLTSKKIEFHCGADDTWVGFDS